MEVAEIIVVAVAEMMATIGAVAEEAVDTKVTDDDYNPTRYITDSLDPWC